MWSTYQIPQATQLKCIIRLPEVNPTLVEQRNHTCQGYPGYLREPHWKSMGLPEVSRVTWQICKILTARQSDNVSLNTTMAEQHGRHFSLEWRHNGRDSVSNHQPHDCLLNRLSKRRSKKTSKLRVTGLCAGNSPGTGEFPAQRASNAENIFIWWRHHVMHFLE